MRILFTGGGTGGHIYPLIAVTEALQKNFAKAFSTQSKPVDKLELFYLGVPGSYSLFLEKNNLAVFSIISSKWRHYFDTRNFIDIFKFALSFFQALVRVVQLKPDVLFSKGGPGALAVVLACRILRVPVIIHDSDVIPGLSNRISILFAQKALVSFKEARVMRFKNAEVVGNPIILSLLQDINKKRAKTDLGFESDKPLLLILGGSQGAARLNRFFSRIAREIIKETQVLHQTGPNGFQDTRDQLEQILGSSGLISYKITPFFDDQYASVLAAADIIVARAGAGTIFEIAAFGKPAILIPIPESVHPHQVANARAYADSGAAIMIEEKYLSPQHFLMQLNSLLGNSKELKLMSSAAKSFSKPDAAKIIAERIIEFGGGG